MAATTTYMDRMRLDSMYSLQWKYPLLGMDEVGTGAAAGPIAVGAVILAPELRKPLHEAGLRDSKMLSQAHRASFHQTITERTFAHIWLAWPDEIDEHGMQFMLRRLYRQAAHHAWQRHTNLVILTDGEAQDLGVPSTALHKGDDRSLTIAAAAVFAKEERDGLMREYAEMYPEYGFERNYGYLTREHKEAIRRYGLSPIHRKSVRIRS